MADGQITEAAIREAAAQFPDPETGRAIGQLQQIQGLDFDGQTAAVTLGLTSWSAPLWEETRADLATRLQTKFPEVKVTVSVVECHRPAEKLGELGVPAKSVIAIGSGKGGVGKSSVAVLLAYGLCKAGCKVGLLDSDVYGPSIPHLIGSEGRPEMVNDRIQPVLADGLKVMSMGFLVPTDQAVIWRGPMLHGAITQFLRDTAWEDLDYLIIDMPPGTGDVALSLSQLLPLTGAVVVCTPQDVALLDAAKAIAMFRKLNIEVLGVVENMSFFLCPECNTRHDIFGSGGAKRKAAELGVPFLGEVPLQMQLRILGDEGNLGAALGQKAAKPYLEAICHRMVTNMAAQRRQHPTLPGLPVLGQ